MDPESQLLVGMMRGATLPLVVEQWRTIAGSWHYRYYSMGSRGRLVLEAGGILSVGTAFLVNRGAVFGVKKLAVPI